MRPRHPTASCDDAQRTSSFVGTFNLSEAQRLTHTIGAGAQRVHDSRVFTYEYACVDQESIVLADPRVLADPPREQRRERRGSERAEVSSDSARLEHDNDGWVPSMDLSSFPYYLYQATPQHAYERLVQY